MANTFGGTTWNLDTTGIICTYPIYVKSIRLIAEAASGGDNFSITDPVTGYVLWEEVAPGTNFVSSDLIEKQWINGMTLTSLGGVAGAKVMIDLG